MEQEFFPEGGCVRTGEPSYRVFLFTREVTEDVKSVNITWSIIDSTCSIELANPREKWIITEDNLKGVWREDEKVKKAIYNKKKTFIVSEKSESTINDKDSKPKSKNSTTHNEAGTCIYDLYEGDSVISCGDTVRVYIKDPFSDYWYRGFTGYASPVTDSYNAEADYFTLTVHCEDTKRWIRATRLGWGVWGSNSPVSYATTEEANKASVYSIWQHVAPGMSLEELVVWLITGKGLDSSIVGNMKETTNKDQKIKELELRCGNFTLGKRFVIKNNKDVEEAQLFLMDECLRVQGKGGDAEDLITEEGKFVTRLGSGEYAKKVDDGNIYNVDGQIHVIIPEFLTHTSKDESGIDLKPHTMTSEIGYRDEYSSRLGIIKDWADTVEFEFYALPNGDVVLEFPQYDFRPEDYGEANKSVTSGEIFKITNKEITGWNITEDDSGIDTLFVVGGSLEQYFKKVGDMAQLDGRIGFAAKESLAKRFGWRCRNLDAPLITSKEGCELLAEALLNRSFANAKTMRVDCTARYETWPGRPYQMEGRKVLGYCTSIEHVLIWGSQIKTTINLGYLRGWNEKRKEWTTIGGRLISEERRFLDYSKLYAKGT